MNFPFLDPDQPLSARVDDLVSRLTLPEKVAQLQSLLHKGAEVTLGEYLEHTGLDLADVYAGNRSWSDLREAAGLEVRPAGPHERALRRAIA